MWMEMHWRASWIGVISAQLYISKEAFIENIAFAQNYSGHFRQHLLSNEYNNQVQTLRQKNTDGY